MRFFLPALVLVGCGSSWTCPKGDELHDKDNNIVLDEYGNRICRFPNPFVSTPRWADCDNDGWGDRDTEPECIDLDAPKALPCEEEDGKWVANGLDCDDTAKDAGAQVGMACPSDYDDGSNLVYSVSEIGGREYLFWLGQPEHNLQAQEICQNWWTNPLQLATEQFNYEETDDLGGLLSLSAAERGGVMSSTAEFMSSNHLETWDVWVDVQLSNPEGPPAWIWGVGQDEDRGIRLEDWCTGPPDPVDIFPIYEGVAGPAALQMFEQTRLVMHFYYEPDGGPFNACLAAPNDPIVCPDGECSTFDFVCERRRSQKNCQQSGDEFNPSCLNVLTLSDLVCEQ